MENEEDYLATNGPIHDELLAWIQLAAPGLGVRWVGGHSICSQFIYVNTQKGLVLFSGDTVQMYKNVELDDPVAICHDVVQCRAALALARTDVDVLLPGHDPKILLRFPGGRVT